MQDPLEANPSDEPADALSTLDSAWHEAAVIVAHPDDETLWAGGLILSHPECKWLIASLCRGSDPDRSPRFFRVLDQYRALGCMADLDDGPQQEPLPIPAIQEALLKMLPARSFDLILTHAPTGEYTRHRRHEEVSCAVYGLWLEGALQSEWLGMFAYADDQGKSLPRALPSAHRIHALPLQIFQEKNRLITEVYGFAPASWEARTTPGTEGFWFFNSQAVLKEWLHRKELD